MFSGLTGGWRVERHGDTVAWTIIEPPSGDYYLPQTATLRRAPPAKKSAQ